MNTRLLLILLSLSTLTFAQGNAPVISTRITGAFADSTFTINGHTVNLSVNQGTNGNNQEQTLLIYAYGFSNSDGSSTFVFAGGYLPNDAAVINNDNVARLNVDTSQVAGFRVTSCTFFPGSPSTCTPGPFGVIQIDWNHNGVTSHRSISEDWKTFPGARLHTQLNTDTSSASATGSFLGTGFNSDLGNIGTSRNSLFEVF